MADAGFNGSILGFPTTGSTDQLYPLRSIDFRESATKIPLSGSTDSEIVNKTGLPERVVTATLVGGTTIAIGNVGELRIIWNDAGIRGSMQMANTAIVSDVGTAGNFDGEISSTLEFSRNAT
jgi:hypothetical protein